MEEHLTCELIGNSKLEASLKDKKYSKENFSVAKKIKLEIDKYQDESEFDTRTQLDIKSDSSALEIFKMALHNSNTMKRKIFEKNCKIEESKLELLKKEQEREKEQKSKEKKPPVKLVPEKKFYQISIVPRQKRDKASKVLTKGDICFVSRYDGYLYSSEVIETRVGENGTNEYYVHFFGLNRRLDEWVGADRLHMSVNTDRLKNNIITDDVEDYDRDDDLEKKLKSESGDRTPGRNLKKVHNDPTSENLDAEDAERERDHIAQTKVKNIERVFLGDYAINTWYFSPYPDPYGKSSTLYVCEYCLKYMQTEIVYWQHCGLCPQKAPPGKLIYRKGNIGVYEVDGKDHKLYCQLLCLMAKLFLDHKTLFYEMDPFIFYVLCEIDERGSHIVGYFSKEKDSIDNNVACILVLPPFQRRGYGKFLIGFSYELSIREMLPGTPEKPLSDLGKISYVSYWCYTLLTVLEKNSTCAAMSLDGMREHTGMMHEDIIYTLQTLKLLKYWKSHSIAVLQPDHIRALLKEPQFRAPRLLVDRDCLDWQPSEEALEKARMKKSL